MDDGEDAKHDAGGGPNMIFIIRCGSYKVHTNKLSLKAGNANNEEDVVDGWKQQAQDIYSTRAEGSSDLRDNGQQDGDNDNGDTR